MGEKDQKIVEDIGTIENTEKIKELVGRTVPDLIWTIFDSFKDRKDWKDWIKLKLESMSYILILGSLVLLFLIFLISTYNTKWSEITPIFWEVAKVSLWLWVLLYIFLLIWKEAGNVERKEKEMKEKQKEKEMREKQKRLNLVDFIKKEIKKIWLKEIVDEEKIAYTTYKVVWDKTKLLNVMKNTPELHIYTRHLKEGYKNILLKKYKCDTLDDVRAKNEERIRIVFNEDNISDLEDILNDLKEYKEKGKDNKVVSK